MRKTFSFVILMILSQFCLGSCGGGLYVPPAPWPLLEGNGVKISSFSLDGSPRVDAPSASLLSLVDIHGEVEFKVAAIYYEGGGRIGELRFDNSIIVGYPIFAFTYKERHYMVTLYPLTRQSNPTDIGAYTFFMYKLENGQLQVMGNKTKHTRNALRRRSIFLKMPEAQEWDSVLEVLPSLRFEEKDLEFYILSWYFEALACVIEENFNEGNDERAENLLESLVKELESKVVSSPQNFGISKSREHSAEYFAREKGKMTIPKPNVLYFYFPVDETPGTQSIYRRIQICWTTLLHLEKEGKIALAPEIIEMYQKRLKELEWHTKRGLQKNGDCGL